MGLSDRLRGLSVLVVEDEYFLAEALSDELLAHGARVVGPAATLGDSLALAGGRERIDAAILDVNLDGELAYAVADRLAERQVPFVFTTGYDDSALPTRFRGARSFRKPYAMGDVLRALAPR